MKYDIAPMYLAQAIVAPRMGAWIEISNYGSFRNRSTVAPRMGAWIEILSICFVLTMISVAPRMGAWIEIPKRNRVLLGEISRSPHGGRGLKLHLIPQSLPEHVSLPAWGAWIEMYWAKNISPHHPVAPRMGGVD